MRERDDALLSELAQSDEAAGVGYVSEGELIHEALALPEMLLEPISLFADVNRHKPLRQMRWSPGCATIGVVTGYHAEKSGNTL